MNEIIENSKPMIKELAKLKPYEEICGIILKNGDIIPCENISNKKSAHFLIHPDEIKEYCGQILYTYHSHPFSTSVPSREDELIACKNKISGLIYSVIYDEFTFYEYNNTEIPLLGRPFILGTLDCIELVKDYYAQNLNIKLLDKEFFTLRMISYQDMPTSKYNTEKFKGVMKDYFKSLGFSEQNDLRINDVVLFQEKSVIPACHCMVYIGNGDFIGQNALSYSKIHSLKHLVSSGKIKKKAYSILRYNG